MLVKSITKRLLASGYGLKLIVDGRCDFLYLRGDKDTALGHDCSLPWDMIAPCPKCHMLRLLEMTFLIIELV